MKTDQQAGCILFLDFDGVTHPDPCQAAQLFRKLPLIEEVLRDFDACKIVISSSWRMVHRLEEMRGYFAVDMQSRVIDVTPEYRLPSDRGTADPALHYHRQWECEAWLRQALDRVSGTAHRDAPWIAIDDRDDWFRRGCGNLLLTDSRTGFEPADAVRLETMLRQRLK